MAFPDDNLFPSDNLFPGDDRGARGIVPRLRIPLTFNGSVLEVVEQDSQDDVAQCVYAVAATELGSREERTEFGVTSPLFRQGGADLTEIQGAVDRWEPRASIESTQELIDSLDHIRIEVS